ncbi:zinc-ribbon domain-containing protein [Streptomyces sp. NPDC015127]|uniref:zinc-ribbon domain-containing protein n=1 Tax=Streptomyces sp. NPDC015127 TaxID=3364939 RepID=UPI0036F77E4D
MASYCGHCGAPSPDEARFCMKCGKERLPETAPPVPVPAQAPVPVPPPPAYGPGPAVPSPVTAFFGRALRGDWAASVQAALWPTGLLLVLATALAIPSYGQEDEVVVGWSDRLRIALALLMQGFGGGFGLKAADGAGFGIGGSTSDGGRFGWGDTSGGYGDGSGFSDSGTDAVTQGTASLSLAPLTVTVLWIAALYVGARMLRARGAGLEAAVRVSLVVTAAVLVLGLFAQPGIAGVEVSSSPLLAALGALVLSAAVTAGVLQRDDLAAWLAQRPAARSAVRAFGTAVRALAVVVALCSLAGFVFLASNDDADGTALLIALPLLPNIGLAVLGLTWGVPVAYDVRGDMGLFGWGAERGSFGLGEISDVWGGGAVAGMVALGVVSALILGVWAARRSADRRERLLAGAFALGLLLLFTGVSGLSAELAGGLADFGGQGFAEVAPSVPDALLFGLLWVGGATFVCAFLPGRPQQWPAAQAPYTPAPMPYGPGTAPAAPAPYAPAPPAPGVRAPAADAGGPEVPAAAAAGGPHDPYTVRLGAPQGPVTAPPPLPAGPDGGVTGNRRRKVLLWTVTLVAAFVVGGGATAGALIWQDRQDEDAAPATQDRQSAPPAQTPDAKPRATPSPAASSSPSATSSPSASPGGDGTLPAGFVLRQDPAGFTVAVMEGWTRRQAGSQVFYEAPTGGDYLQIGVIRDTPMSSYENFTGLEKKHLANPESDYRRLRLERNTYQGRPGALWEFTHIPEPDEGGLVRHVIDQAFVAADGTEYAILAAGRADRWDPDKDVVFSTAVATFTAG